MDVDLATTEVYQLRIVLREIGPAISRRVLVRSDSTITDQHYTLQLTMGWTDSYLNQFIIHGKDYGGYHLARLVFPDDLSVRWRECSFSGRCAKIPMKDFGVRVQNSIFEVNVSPAAFAEMKWRCAPRRDGTVRGWREVFPPVRPLRRHPGGGGSVCPGDG